MAEGGGGFFDRVKNFLPGRTRGGSVDDPFDVFAANPDLAAADAAKRNYEEAVVKLRDSIFTGLGEKLGEVQAQASTPGGGIAYDTFIDGRQSVVQFRVDGKAGKRQLQVWLIDPSPTDGRSHITGDALTLFENKPDVLFSGGEPFTPQRRDGQDLTDSTTGAPLFLRGTADKAVYAAHRDRLSMGPVRNLRGEKYREVMKVQRVIGGLFPARVGT